jgi:NADPH:quinone reductase
MFMRANLVEEANGPFRAVELPRPVPEIGHVLIRIAASGVNPLDTKIRAGKAAHARQPLPAVLGVDMAGIVEEVGPAVTTFRPGDEVYGMVGGVGGLQGTLAEFISADVDLIARKPANLSMRESAALPLSVITAWEGLVDRADIQAGQSVLVHAGASGVGHIVVQIAHAFGAVVFATVSPEKRHVVESFGASPIDYRSVPVSQYVSASTGGAGFDIVYDTVGGSTLDFSFDAVRRYTGHVVSCLGWGSHSLAPLSFRGATYSGVFSLLPLLTGEGRRHHGEILAKATALIEAGKLRPLLNQRTFSADEIAQAHSLVETGALGKVVIGFQAHRHQRPQSDPANQRQ